MIPLLLIGAGSACLLLLMTFNFFTQVEPGRLDLNFLREKNLYALHLLRVVQSTDYQFFSRSNRKYRDYLFLSYARNLKEDMDELAALPLGGTASLYYLSFRVLYMLLVVKSRIYAGTNDLRCLLGIELMLVKTMAS